MSSSGPRMTAQTQDVLAALLADPSTPRYGLQIAHATELPVGTVYPVLRRLVEAGWLADSMEDPAAAEAEGRPRRRYYRLTAQGQARAVHALHRARDRHQRISEGLRGRRGALGSGA